MALGPTQGGYARLPTTISRIKCIWVGLYDQNGGGPPSPQRCRMGIGWHSPFDVVHHPPQSKNTKLQGIGALVV